MNTLDFLESVYACNLEFQQDFMCVALAIKLPAGMKLELLPDDNSHRSSLGDLGKYLRWGWGIPSLGDPQADSIAPAVKDDNQTC